MIRLIILSFCFFTINFVSAQIDSTKLSKLSLEGDFRFRIEQDWNGQNSSGIQLNDRTRLRYRLRYGFQYKINTKGTVGARIRTGKPNNQQDPHLTIGDGLGEFGLTNIGLEKLFYQYESKYFRFWIGKNAIPIRQNNELFWNENVFPEGVALKIKVPRIDNNTFSALNINAGHFIIKSNNSSFSNDSYLQVIQMDIQLLNNKINLFPTYSYFHQIGDIPDGKYRFLVDYSIFQFGSLFKLDKAEKFKLTFDYFLNLQEYPSFKLDHPQLQNQKTGFVVAAKYGETKSKGDLLVELTYARMEKYSVVDYFAQNDWITWGYSSFDASGSRITNFQGLELKLKYTIKEGQNLVMRAFYVEELVLTGSHQEKGNRIRLDYNVKF